MWSIFLTCLAGSFLTNPVAAAMLPAPSTVFWATAVTPVTTAPPTWDTPDTVLPATVRTTGRSVFEKGVSREDPHVVRGWQMLNSQHWWLIGSKTNLSGNQHKGETIFWWAGTSGVFQHENYSASFYYMTSPLSMKDLLLGPTDKERYHLSSLTYTV